MEYSSHLFEPHLLPRRKPLQIHPRSKFKLRKYNGGNAYKCGRREGARKSSNESISSNVSNDCMSLRSISPKIIPINRALITVSFIGKQAKIELERFV